MPRIAIDGDRVRISGVRNFDFRGRDDFEGRYEDREVSLSRMTGVDFYVSYWAEGPVGHTFLSFLFEDAPPLGVSIETRPEIGEGFDPLGSLFKQFELIYVVASEQDLVGLRASHRAEEVFLYHTRISPEFARRLLPVYADRINQLADHAEWYHLLSNSCTVNIIRYANKAGRDGRFNIRHLLNGLIDQYIYSAGVVDTSLPFDELRRRSRITEAARAAEGAPDFSTRIRAGIPAITELTWTGMSRARDPCTSRHHSPIAGIAAVAMGIACPATAQTVEGGSPAESRWTRDTVGGDWGGIRNGLAHHGVAYDLWVTGLYQGMPEGDGYDDWDFGSRGDLVINADTAKLGLWDGGGLHTHLTYRHGSLGGFRGGAILPVNTDGVIPLDGKGDLVATSLYVSQRFGATTRLMAGKINVLDLISGPFFGGWGTDRFWNLAFVAPPTGVVPPVILGAVLGHASPPFALSVMVFDPHDQTHNHSPDDLFDDGVNLSLGISWTGALSGRRSSAGITGTYSTAEGIDLSEIALPPELRTRVNEGSYNVGVDFSHLVLESPQGDGRGLGVYARAAIADGNPNPIRGSFVGGIAGEGMVTGRPDDTFGIGYFYYGISKDLQSAVAPFVDFEDEQGVEAYYTFVPVPWLRMTADLQWVDAAVGANRSVWVAGVRVRIAF